MSMEPYSVEVVNNQVRVTLDGETSVVVLKDPQAAAEHAVLLEASFAAGQVEDLIGRHLADNDPQPQAAPEPEPEPVAEEVLTDVDPADLVTFDLEVEYRPETGRLVITVDTPRKLVLWCELGDREKTLEFKKGRSSRAYKVPEDGRAVIRGDTEDGPVLWEDLVATAVDDT